MSGTIQADNFLNSSATGGPTLPYGLLYGINIQTITSYNLENTDSIVIFSGLSGAGSATLPSASGISGKIFEIKNISSFSITIFTSAGQTIDGYASGVFVLSPKDYITVISTGVNWIVIDVNTAVTAAYKLSGNQGINNNSSTGIIWNSKITDTYSAMNTSSGAFTVPFDGFYLVSGSIGYESNATGLRYASINNIELSSISAALGDFTGVPFSFGVRLLSGNTISVQATQSSGGSLNIDTNSYVVISKVANF